MSVTEAPVRTGAQAAPAAHPLLAIEDLVVEFKSADGQSFRAVDGVSLKVEPGQIVAIVGESGSGKSVSARSVLRLVPHPGRIRSGKIVFQGRDILRMSRPRVRQLRGQLISMVFQDPMTSLNPVLRVGTQIGEAIRLHARLSAGEIGRRVLALLKRVGIPATAERANSYPHEYSGGMRQRAMIAMGVSNSPALLIADEPTTALDVTIQDQIIALMRELNRNSGTAILLITHNVALVASLCSRVVVMYAGRIVEEGPTDAIFTAPQHPYTWSLLRSVPRIDKAGKERLLAIRGQPPNPRDLPSGCKFHPRCPFAIARCGESEPALARVGDDHAARCWVLMKNVPEAAAS
ncbi:MAG: ABC transporter ATP-binding protein [Variibacter sp.]|nr:ABC transporter ATP-binding protein [Variibacter sp.]